MAPAGDTPSPPPSGATASPDEATIMAPVHRWPRGMLWVGIGVLLVGLIVTSWAIWQQGIKARYAAIRARGEPLTFADLDAAYPHPAAGEDTTYLLLPAGNMLVASASKAEWRPLPFVGDTKTDIGPGRSELELARGYLAENSGAFEQLHKAADLGCQARFDGVVSPQGMDAAVNYAQPLRGACRALCLEANVRLHQGDPPALAESLAAAIKLERALANEPRGVSQLVRAAIFGMAAYEAKQALGTVNFSDGELNSLQDALTDIDFQRGLRVAFLGERVYMVTGGSRSAYSGPGPRSYEDPLWEIAAKIDAGRYLDYMAEYAAATELPWHQMLDECRSISARELATYSRWRWRLNVPTPGSIVNMTVNQQTFAELTRRLLLLAIALERYRLRHGAAPTDLAALVPEFLAEVPDDPTDGRPLSYRPSASGYVLYSETKDFPLPSGDVHDAETGANPSVMIRRPPLTTPQPKAAE